MRRKEIARDAQFDTFLSLRAWRNELHLMFIASGKCQAQDKWEQHLIRLVCLYGAHLKFRFLHYDVSSLAQRRNSSMIVQEQSLAPTWTVELFISPGQTPLESPLIWRNFLPTLERMLSEIIGRDGTNCLSLTEKSLESLWTWQWWQLEMRGMSPSRSTFERCHMKIQCSLGTWRSWERSMRRFLWITSSTLKEPDTMKMTTVPRLVQNERMNHM